MIKIKNITAIFLAVLLLIVTTFETNIFTVSAETVKIGIISATDVRIRADASTNSQILDKVSNITTTVIDEKQGTDNSYLWYKVTFVSKGSEYATSGTTITGYVREDLITVTTYSTSVDFEESLKAFPESYHQSLRTLHSIYPNWKFIADEISITFDEAVDLEYKPGVKLVEANQGLSWRSMQKGCYDWDTGNYILHDGSRWYGASREVIEYYMDPRNFLDETGIYIFLKQGYDPTVDYTEGVNKIIAGTFLENGYSDENDTQYNGSYTQVIIEAGRQSGVSPYVLASTIRQEHGVDGTSLSNGIVYNNTTVYNFFNYGASGVGDAVLTNGAAYAYNSGWTTRSASIIGGAKKYGDGYVSVGQDTYFYKNYNIINPNKINHQYAQNAGDSLSSAKSLKKIYSDQHNWELIFRIPVYKDNSLPEKVSEFPPQNNNQNNYYFNNIVVEGLSPTFTRYNYEYALQIDGDTSVYVELPATASLASPTSYTLSQGENKITLSVKAQTGYTNDYTIFVNANNSCTLTITTDKPITPSPDTPQPPNPDTPQPTPTILRGDSNCDGSVSLSDLSNVRLHLLGTITLTGDKFKGADTNNDGKISISDLSNIRLHLLGTINLNKEG